ncbi:hypothetical protein VIGAN_07162300 [Vigna angularis var. angularis]|uniref:Uncharacterized protein n=1 Tax=Vigna angularis var. angularis TaxID=157739 RepID=A0A0S3SIY0_PHAAN|nr:hypothetical protein VIGAN_07162300 [Vigna angularis var. angularis]
MVSLCRGYSKTQMCFFKILHIISSTPPSTEQREEQQESFPNKGVGIDLTLRFSSLTESESSRIYSASATLQNSIEEEQEEGFRDKSFQLSEKLNDNKILTMKLTTFKQCCFRDAIRIGGPVQAREEPSVAVPVQRLDGRTVETRHSFSETAVNLTPYETNSSGRMKQHQDFRGRKRTASPPQLHRL